MAEETKTNKAQEETIHLRMGFPKQDEKNSAAFMYLTETKLINKSLVNEILNSGQAYQSQKEYEYNGEIKTQRSVVFTNSKGYAIEVNFAADPFKVEFRREYNSEENQQYLMQETSSSKLSVYNNPISMLTQQSLDMISNNESPHNMICCSGKHADAVADFIAAHPGQIQEVVICLDKDLIRNDRNMFYLRDNVYSKIAFQLKEAGIKTSKGFTKMVSLNQEFQKAFGRTPSMQNKMHENQNKPVQKNEKGFEIGK